MSTKNKQNLILDNCSHKNVINTTADVVCKDCGMVISEIFTDSSYAFAKDHNPHGSSKQYVALGDIMNKVCTLGTSLDYNGSKYLKDSNGRLLNPDGQKLFRRIKEKHHQSNLKGKETEFRILTVLNKIGQYLDLSAAIIDGSAYRYKIIFKSNIKVINHITCLFFCIWDTIRFYQDRICFNDLYKAFRAYGHRVGKRLLIRDGCIYRELLYNAGVPKSSVKHPKNYISRHLAELNNNKNEVKKRLEEKRQEFPTVEHFLMKIEVVCYDILNRLDKPIEKYCANPVILSASCIYFADIIIAQGNNKKKVLTQEFIARLCEVPAYSIRNIYVNFFKLFTTMKKSQEIEQLVCKSTVFPKKREDIDKGFPCQTQFLEHEGNQACSLDRLNKSDTITYPQMEVRSACLQTPLPQNKNQKKSKTNVRKKMTPGKNLIMKEFSATKEYISPAQYNIIKTLEDKGPLTRNELVSHLNRPRTTIYDNLIKLQKRRLIQKNTKNNGHRGRPLIYWRLV